MTFGKKIIFLMAAAASFAAANAQDAAEVRYRPLKLINADFMVPSTNEIVGWSPQNKTVKVEMKVLSDENGKFLDVTPVFMPKQNYTRTQAMNALKFPARIGDRIKIEIELRSEGGKAGLMLWNGRYNQWLIWKRPVPAKWQKFSMEYTIKPVPKDLDPKSVLNYQFAVDIWDKPVQFRNVKVYIRKTGESK